MGPGGRAIGPAAARRFVIAGVVTLSLWGCSPREQETVRKPPAAQVLPAAPEYPDRRPREKKRIDVRGIYVTSWTAGGQTRWSELVKFVDASELNAMVIDVKDDGNLSYSVDLPLAKKIGADKKRIPDIDIKLAILQAKDIYPIARITCFRDNILPLRRRDLAVQRSDGSPWRDRSGHTWLDPYRKENWDYLVGVAIDAAKRGFREIQWDYVRFPSEGRSSSMRFPGKDERTEVQVIGEFLEYAHEKLQPYNVWVAADVFGLVTRSERDLGIGQNFSEMSKHLDYICPMIYPSHYSSGEYNLKDPNRSAYLVVLRAVKEANVNLKKGKSECRIRPWLQDFSLFGVRYGERQVRAQMQASRENGVTGYLFWNASNRYTSSAYYPKPKGRTATKIRSPGVKH